MFALSAGEKQMIDALRDEVRRLGLIATDMETATLLTAGRVLGARAASLCLGTVDGLTQEKIGAVELETQERRMFEIALDAIVASLSA
jgi:uridine phosphorylase